MHKLLSALLLTGGSLQLSAQTGQVSGTILDSKTGETLPGATILIEGTTKGAIADFDGKFSITKLEPGTYTLVASYISYTPKKTTGVVVTNNEITEVSVLLEPASSQDLEQVDVVITIDKGKTTALVLQQKNSASVSDGISSELITKTPDRNTSDVLKRVSGASIQDNKFAIIRGLSDRYNAAFINGSPLPSTESDRKAFAFDIFPAIMLDNLVIIKTATPDMPAEFAGGVININTKNIPEKNFNLLSIGGSYHSLTTFKNFKTYEGGKYDWLGIDDGKRGIPKQIPATSIYETLSADEKANMAKFINAPWGIDNIQAKPALNLQYSFGRNLKLARRDFGVVFAYTYQNGFIQNKSTRREFEESGTGVVLRSELVDDVYTSSVLNSSLLNFTYKLTDNHQLSFKNMYSINSDDKVTIRNGVRELDNDPHQFEKSSNRWFTQNLLYTGQLEGSHFFRNSRMKLKWVGGFSDVNRKVPNMRRVVYQKQALDIDDTTSSFAAVIQNNGTIPTAAGNMFWSDTREKIYSLRYDLSIPLNLKKIKNEIKVGGMQQIRDRSFEARNLGFSRYRKSTQPSAPFDSELLLLPEDQIFAPENLGLKQNEMGGFKLEEATKVHDSYLAGSVLHAGYLMTDSRIAEKFRIVGGARIESYQQVFSYKEIGSNLDRKVDTTVTDLLPSVNLIYSLNDRINIRTSYYRTVSRPEFRELAPFQFYNFAIDNILSGSPSLKRALIDNADLRFEYFPGAGQILSVSGFYKKFTDPIELFMRSGTSGAAELSYTNVPRAENVGLELEYRLKLDFFSKNDSSIFLSNSTLFTNLALIRSRVDVSQINGANERPLQGQSPYLINAGFQFSHPTQWWSASISYNVAGRRIYIVGNVQEPDIWENARHVIDFQITKTFREKFELRLNIKDLLANDLLFYQNVNSQPKYEQQSDNRWQETTFGRTVSLSLNYRF